MQLRCPFCGWRDVEEFHFRRVKEESSDAIKGVYDRSNRPTLSVEYWQHTDGCRAWLELRRSPSSNAVISTKMLADAIEAAEE